MNTFAPTPARRRRALALVIAAIVVVLPDTATAADAVPAFRLTPLPNTYSAPVWVGGAPGTATLHVAQRNGVIYQQDNGSRRVWLDLRRVVNDEAREQGLLSMAFSHDFRDGDGRVFVYFTTAGGYGQVRQYQVADHSVVAGSGRNIIRVPLSPPSATNHNGGQLWSRPGNMLFLSIGDGGAAGDPRNNAQNLSVLMGKIIRIAPRVTGGYTIPSSNPFISRPGARREVWALGLRNPWRFSFDTTGQLWIGDGGHGRLGEINHVPAGSGGRWNFGWRRYEGRRAQSTTPLTRGTRYQAPRLAYANDQGRCSVTGGVVYRGPVVSLRGWYIYADQCANRIYGYHPGTRSTMSRAGVAGIVHFGTYGSSSSVVVASARTGRIYEVVPAASTTPTVPAPPATSDDEWPAAHNTGVPSGASLTTYDGPLAVTAPDTVIRNSIVNGILRIEAPGVQIINSRIYGGVDLRTPRTTNHSYTITDSEVHIGDNLNTGLMRGNFTADRVEITGGRRSVYCEYRCTVANSWVHAQGGDVGGDARFSGIRMGESTTVRHNTITCEALRGPGTGCSAGLTGYGDFGPVQNNLIERNIFRGGNSTVCAYGGSSGDDGSKPYGHLANNVRFVDNVFVRGATGGCGNLGAVASFDSSRPGNLWTGNSWDDGSTIHHTD